MIKLGYVAPKRGGKTQFLIAMIQEEFSQGHRCYYLGGQKHYEEVTEKLVKQGVPCDLEYNPGNHFKDADIRTAKAFARVINNL